MAYRPERGNAAGGAEYLLKVEGLCSSFSTDTGLVRVLEGIDLELKPGETLGIVGESGSGKSLTALSIMRLLAGSAGRIDGGRVIFKGRDLRELGEREMRKIRGNEIAMIFQEPGSSLNPLMKIGDQIIESIRLHQRVSRREARGRALEALRKARLSPAESILSEYPFQLSGGQLQRVMVAMSLVCKPSLLIADEPTAALDLTIQAQILELMTQLRQDTGAAIIFITHDLGVVAELCDQVAVMYCGRIVEKGSVYDIFDRPANPYTQGLLASIPKPGIRAGELESIPGNPPNPRLTPPGCKFRPRCKYAREICGKEEPAFSEAGSGHYSRCWLKAGQAEGRERGGDGQAGEAGND
ncbi:MAG: ABC transporter ATP-binding protein [Treponema sp.]|jgi:oligopeptide/dipeptide ABC transporter ATP-binding protein|nr:ABC transporter ATP-binding protein [Treponema sp.]